MVLKSVIISLIVSIISTIISKLSIIISMVSIISIIIIHGSAPLNKQEVLGMPTMY